MNLACVYCVCMCVCVSLMTSFIAEKKMHLRPVLKLLWETVIVHADELGRRSQVRVTVLSMIHVLNAAGSIRTRTAGESTESLFILLISNISGAFSQNSFFKIFFMLELHVQKCR